MMLKAIEIAAGVLLVVFALRDVFDTVVVPGESRGALRVARRLLAVTLPFWKWARRGKSGVSTSFAPAILIGSFLIWMVLLWLGFGVIAHALGEWFSPAADFQEALFIVGSALCTVGLSGIEAHGPARWALILAGLSGLSVLTLMFEFLIEDRESRTLAILLRSEGLRLIDDLNGLIGLEPKSDNTTAAAVPRVCARLKQAGYKVRSSVDAAEFADRRRKHAGRVRAAAQHLGTMEAPLLP
jgi:hypothetical protein